MELSKLKSYAKLIVRIGANVQKGQPVVLYSNVEDAYFAKLVIEECYLAGASIVNVEWGFDEATKLQYKYCDVEELKKLPNWIIERWKYRAETLPACIYLESSDPDALKDIDQNKMMEVRKATGPIIRPIRKTMENKYQWTIVAIPGVEWAKKLFPNETNENAIEKLWDAILSCARANGDAVDNWNKHNAYLLEKCTKLNNLGIDKLIYKANNGTDFEIKLQKGLQFLGGGENTIGGVYYNPNMPTEECFITPDKNSANGVVYSSKPLSLQGKVVDNFGFKFKDGKVIEVLAKNDADKQMLTELISLDEGASRLGEVALVPFNSPVNESGILFFNTLFDENACCHLALGMGFEDTIIDFANKTKEEIESFGINDSIIHVDFMIGTADLSIKAILDDGKEVAIFKDGTWAI